jgi:Leucine-rich repeat (LRR) protein
MKLSARKCSFPFLMLLVFIIVGCGDKATNNAPSTGPAELEPYAKDTLAVRKMLDTNQLTAVAVGEVITNVVVIDSKTQAAVKRIGELKLQNRGISIIPSTIGQLTGLRILKLDSNNIAVVPPEIGKCVALTQITLSNNKLTGLPPEIGKLDSLQTLIVSHNALSSFPEQVASIASLENVWFDFNALTSIPATISSLTNVKRLALNNNALAELPSSMNQLPIMFLTIGNNKLCTVADALKQWLNQADPEWNSTQQQCS